MRIWGGAGGSLVVNAKSPHREDAIRFLEDTDDTVRIAASDLLVLAGRDQDREALLEALLTSVDRPRVLANICSIFALKDWSVAGRKADVEKLLPHGFYLTREGALKKMGRADAS